jgi:hypothetical protein
MTTTTTTTAAALFDALTRDELEALRCALITPGPAGYQSNRLSGMLGHEVAEGNADGSLYSRYSAVASEVGHLHHEACQAFIARCQA